MKPLQAIFFSIIFLLAGSGVYGDTLCYDNFNDNNDSGWIKPDGGDWRVDSGVYHRGIGSFPSTDFHYISYVGGSSWTDYTLEADVNVLEDVPGGWGAVVFRVMDKNNFFTFQFEPYTGSVHLNKFYRGLEYGLNRSATYMTSKNTWYRIKVAVKGDSIFCYVNSSLRITYKDTTLRSGGAGLAAWHSHSHFDNFLVTSVPGSPKLIAVSSPTFNRRPLLTWHAAAGAEQYVVQADTAPGFVSPLVSLPVADTFFRPLVNLPLDTIYWRVANNTGGYYWSAVSSFFIQDSVVPILIHYVPDPTTNRRPTLRWRAVRRTGSTPYTIQIDTVANFTSPLYTVPTSDTFFTPLTNLPLKRIYWRVKSNLSTVYSLTESLGIVSDSLPLLIAVVPETTTNRRPVLRWHRATGAVTYRLQIDTVGNFVNPWIVTPVSDTFFVPLTNLPATRICWRVSNMEYHPDLYSAVDTFWVKIAVSAEGIPAGMTSGWALRLGGPNPFKATTVLSLGVPSACGRVSLAVYDIHGRMVRYLVDKALPRGNHSVVFDGNDDRGVPLSAGLYHCVMKSGDRRAALRLLLVK